MRRPSPSIRTLVLATLLAIPACGTPSSSSTTAVTTTTAEAEKPPAIEATLFAPQRSILADLPVTKLLPKDTPAILAVRDPATIVAKLATLSAFAEAKDPLSKALDEAAEDLTKDLPDLADLAKNGVDLSKPAGVIWADPELSTVAIFASVSDEVAMRKWIDERAKQSKRREVLALEDAVVLRAKLDVTRAIVLRKGHVFFVRARDTFGDDPRRVIRAAEGFATTAEADSLGADPLLPKTLASLAYGAQATLFVHAGKLAQSLVASRTKRLDDAKKAREETAKALAEAEKGKKKAPIEHAKGHDEDAERALRDAERAAKEVAILAELGDSIPAIAAGIDLGDREVRLKGFVAMPKPDLAKVFSASNEAHCPVEPRLLAFLKSHLALSSLDKAALPPPPSAWLTATNHPVLKQILSIDGACGALAFEGDAYRSRPVHDRQRLADALSDVAVANALFGPPSKKAKKLEDERTKLAATLRETESALRDLQDEAWRTFAARLGTTAFVAKPVEEGIAIYGGFFAKDPTLTALGEAAITAWLTAGPRWEKWADMHAMQKKLRELDAELDAERQKTMDDALGGVLGGALGDPMVAGPTRPRGISRFDDDVGTLLADPHFGGADTPRVGTGRGGSAVVPGQAGGTKGPTPKP